MKISKMMSLAAVSLASVFLLTSCTATPATSTTETVYTTPAGGSMFEVDGATAKITGTTGDYTLTISDVDNDMTWFTDRPMREAGNAQTSSLPGLWTKGGINSFENTPPNATLTVKNNGKSETFVGELSQPVLSGSALSFKVKPIKEISSSLVGKTLSNPVLVIDSSATDVTLSDGGITTCMEPTKAGSYCVLTIVVENTSGQNYLGSYESATGWDVNTETLEITVSGLPSTVGASPTGWNETYSNGIITATTTIGQDAGASSSIQVSYVSTGAIPALISCTSTFGTCGIS